MSVTPLKSRTNPAYTALGLKLTPSNSPYSRASGARSPHRLARPYGDSGLTLIGILGTTTTSPPAFDCLPKQRLFAWVAGATVIVARLGDDLQQIPWCTQRFYRAHPTAVPISTSPPNLGGSTPTQTASSDPRYRSLTPLRESGITSVGAGSPIGDWGESPSARTWTARERIKTATCVALSPDGSFVALGETGYNPRVLIFHIALETSSEIPVAIIGDHTFGVSCVAWSPDSKYLATLGSNQDGYLHVFSINPRTGNAKSHSSNKCTSFVNALTWISKNTLVTAGTRHVKLWRIEEARPVSPSKQRALIDGGTPKAPASPSSRSLAGRNCLLGSLMDSTFTCITRIAESQAIACTQSGAICLIDDRDGTQQMSQLVDQLQFSPICVTLDVHRGCIWIGGQDQNIASVAISKLRPISAPAETTSVQRRPGRTTSFCRSANVVAIGSIGPYLLTVESDHSIKVVHTAVSENCLGLAALTDGALVSSQCALSLPAAKMTVHGVGVLGVELLTQTHEQDPTHFTWSSDGMVHFWNTAGQLKETIQIALEQLVEPGDDGPNELRVMQASPEADFFVSGDRYGVMRVMNRHTKDIDYEVKAHGSEMLEIAIHQGASQTLIATCARDRTVQLFQRTGTRWRHTQTMTDHSSSVSGILFAHEGKQLLSCSGDRTVAIRDVALKPIDGSTDVAFLPVRTLSLKSAPVSMAMCPYIPDTLFISCMDRSISEFDLSSGRTQSSFRATDTENNDPIVLGSLRIVQHLGLRQRTLSPPTIIIAGVSTTDKSIRLYDRTGALLSREWGHTEGVTALACLSSDDRAIIISTGTDSTIMTWEMLWDPIARSQTFHEEPSLQPDRNGSPREESSPPREATASRTPLRRVLSRAELAEFRRPSDAFSDASPLPSPTTTTRPSSSPPPPRSLRKKPSAPRFSLQSSTSAQSATTTVPAPSLTSIIPSLPPIVSKRTSSNNSPKVPCLPKLTEHQPVSISTPPSTLPSPTTTPSPRAGSPSRSPSPSSARPRPHLNSNDRHPSQAPPNNIRRPSLDTSPRLQRPPRNSRSRTKSCGPTTSRVDSSISISIPTLPPTTTNSTLPLTNHATSPMSLLTGDSTSEPIHLPCKDTSIPDNLPYPKTTTNITTTHHLLETIRSFRQTLLSTPPQDTSSLSPSPSPPEPQTADLVKELELTLKILKSSLQVELAADSVKATAPTLTTAERTIPLAAESAATITPGATHMSGMERMLQIYSERLVGMVEGKLKVRDG